MCCFLGIKKEGEYYHYYKTGITARISCIYCAYSMRSYMQRITFHACHIEMLNICYLLAIFETHSQE